MSAVTSTPPARRTRATLRSAEFGFLGVVVYTRVHTPRRIGRAASAGDPTRFAFGVRPVRTSCWIVGKMYLRILSSSLERIVAAQVPRDSQESLVFFRRPRSCLWTCKKVAFVTQDPRNPDRVLLPL